MTGHRQFQFVHSELKFLKIILVFQIKKNSKWDHFWTNQDCFQIHLHMDIPLNHFQKVVPAFVLQVNRSDSYSRMKF